MSVWGGTVEILKDDFALKDQFQIIYRFINRKLGGHGLKLFHRLLDTRVFDRFYRLSQCRFEENEQNYVVIFNSALLHYYSNGYLNRLKKKYKNIKYILYIIDPMPDGVWQRITQMQDSFDKILTAHPYNTRKYGFAYFPFIYTPPKYQPIAEDKKQLYFCGVVDEHRYEMIQRFIAKCKEEKISYEVHMFKAERYAPIEDENVHYGLVPYGENIARAVNSNCILEIVRENFIGFTQRYYEAIVFNKKLLTNNAEVKDYPYYDERYMQYFDNIEDIDWNWVKDETQVDYQYKGDFEAGQWKLNLLKVMA